MNFIAHAIIATREPEDFTPAYVLGSMLPDFASMCGSRLGAISDEETARGVKLHHRTDDVFHSSPGFVALWERLRLDLEARGVRSGTSRAVGHVGVELLLDGELLTRYAVDDAYLAALDVARDEGVGRAIELRGEGARERFQGLRARLERHGTPRDYADPEIVARRLEAALSRRPRLRILADQAEAVRHALVEIQPLVQAQSQTLLDDVCRGIESAG